MPHSDAVIDPDCVELEGNPAGGPDSVFDRSTEALEVGMPGDDVDVRIDDGHEGLIHVLIADTRRLEQRPVGGSLYAAFDPI
jgi:hypothetical protein